MLYKQDAECKSHHLVFPPLAKCELSFHLFFKPRSNLDARNKAIRRFPHGCHSQSSYLFLKSFLKAEFLNFIIYLFSSVLPQPIFCAVGLNVYAALKAEVCPLPHIERRRLQLLAPDSYWLVGQRLLSNPSETRPLYC